MNTTRTFRSSQIYFPLTVLTLCFLLTTPANAASLFSNWQTVERIEYHANTNAYLVTFSGGPFSTSEGCSGPDFAVIKASATGVATNDQQVDRLVAQVYFAAATGKRVRAWVLGCDQQGAVSHPKVYLLQIQD